MENTSVLIQPGLPAHRYLLSMMFIAASHFVTRVNTSHGRLLAKFVGARTQTRENGKKLEQYLGEPTAKVS